MKRLVSLALGALVLTSAVCTSVSAAEPDQAAIGETRYATLAEAVSAANADADETTIELLADVTVSGLDVEEALVLNGNGFTITTSDAQKTFEVYADLTVNDVTIVNNADGGRCIDTRVGGIALTVNGCELITTGTGTQPLTIGGDAEEEDNGIVVSVIESVIKAEKHGYGIITYNPVEMLIQNSSVTGYAALYMKGADGSVGSGGSMVAVEGSVLHSVNTYTGENDDFGTVVLETDGILFMADGTSTLSCESNGSATQALIALSTNDEGLPVSENLVYVDNGGKLVMTATNDGAATFVSGLVMDMEDGETANLIFIPLEYADEVFDDGNGYVTALSSESDLVMLVVKNAELEAMIGHTHSAENMTKVDAVAATCTEDGILEHYLCADDNCEGMAYANVNGTMVLLDTTDWAMGHVIVEVEAAEATTEAAGNIAHFTCEVCGALFADEYGDEELEPEDVIIEKLEDEQPEGDESGETAETPDSPDTGAVTNVVAVGAVMAAALAVVLVASKKRVRG